MCNINPTTPEWFWPHPVLAHRPNTLGYSPTQAIATHYTHDHPAVKELSDLECSFKVT